MFYQVRVFLYQAYQALLRERMLNRSAEPRDSPSILEYLTIFITKGTRLVFSLYIFIRRLAGMFSYFGIQYDVPQLTGNLYLNMFLVALADVPSSLCVAILNLK